MKYSILLMIILWVGSVFAKQEYPYPASYPIGLRPDYMAKCMMDGFYGKPESIFPDTYYSNNFSKKGSSYPSHCNYDQGRLFFDYLSISESRSCDYETGNEKELREWVLDQPENSIDPVIIFRQSLKINDGKIFNALLTIHQLLRNEARWASAKY